MDERELIGKRFLIENPGTEVANVVACIAPAAVLDIKMIVQEIKSLPLLSELILRMVNTGITNLELISDVLGLRDDPSLEICAAELISNGSIYLDAAGMLGLTAVGRKLATDLKEVLPRPVEERFLFDRSIFKLSNVDYSQRVTPSVFKGSELLKLPTATKANITQDVVKIKDLQSIIGRAEHNVGDRVVIKIEKLLRRSGVFGIPAHLIMYRNQMEPQIQAAFFVNGKFSLEHQKAFNDAGGFEKLGIKIEVREIKSDLPPEIESQRVVLPQLERLRLIPGAEIEKSDDISTPEIPMLRAIKVFEHRPLMLGALATAKERLFIKCPWIGYWAVDAEFISLLEGCIERGVKVTFVHGYQDGSKSHQPTVERLKRLAAKHNNFEILRHENTHGKVLIYDDVKVKGSFNWLNFRADEESTYYCDEDSDVITNRKYADEEYERQMAEIKSRELKGTSKFESRNKPSASSPQAKQKKIDFEPVPVIDLIEGEIIDGVVKSITNFGVFVNISGEIDGLIHISQTGCSARSELEEDFKIGSRINVRLNEINLPLNRYSLGMVY